MLADSGKPSADDILGGPTLGAAAGTGRAANSAANISPSSLTARLVCARPDLSRIGPLFCPAPIAERRRKAARHKSDETWYNQLERWLEPLPGIHRYSMGGV